MIEVQNLRMEYGATVALENLCLKIDDGEVFGLIGPNGAGKTTVFDLISGYLIPDTGRAALDGVEVTTLAVGLFAVGEALYVVSRRHHAEEKLEPIRGSLWMTLEDWKHSWPAWLRGTAFGFPIGALPAGGAEIPTFLSYSAERKLTKHPAEFGKGAIEGVAGPEAANNASAAGVLVPLLTAQDGDSPRRVAARSAVWIAAMGGVNGAAAFAVLPLVVIWFTTRSPGRARRRLAINPMIPFGTTMTKPISNRPTISRLTADEIVTVATSWIVPSNTEPNSGPIQLFMPPTTGIATLLTA